MFKPWTSGIKKAFGFAASAVRRGVELSRGFASFITGGGIAEMPEWKVAYEAAEHAVELGERIKALPPETMLTPTFYEPADVAWSHQYIVRGYMEFYDPEIKTWRREWRQAESDEPLTKEDWAGRLIEVLGTMPGSPPYDPELGVTILEMEPWQRTGLW